MKPLNEKESKAEAVSAFARATVEQERREQDAKTVRLKAARLAKEAEQAITPDPRKSKRGK